jgi:hypothetical protein
MRYLAEVAFAEVVEQWATRENKTVEQLRADRATLVDPLPRTTHWFKIRLCKSDLKRLQVINEFASWSLLTGLKGNLSLAARNTVTFSQKPPNLPNILLDATLTLPAYFARLLDSLNRYRAQAGSPNHNLTLILIASSKDGPYTILEGNHTAVALYFRYFVDHPDIRCQPFVSYIGISPEMQTVQWYHANSY